jgi:hypothetical protein
MQTMSFTMKHANCDSIRIYIFTFITFLPSLKTLLLHPHKVKFEQKLV